MVVLARLSSGGSHSSLSPLRSPSFSCSGICEPSLRCMTPGAIRSPPDSTSSRSRKCYHYSFAALLSTSLRRLLASGGQHHHLFAELPEPEILDLAFLAENS